MSLLTSLTGDSFHRLVRRPSLQVYFDAMDSPITRDGSNNVSQWGDLSGNGNHALRVGSDDMPIYIADKDGFPAIYSDGTSGRKLDFSHNISNSDPLTVIALFLGDPAVTDPTTGSSLNVIFAFGGADASDNSVSLRQLGTDAQDLSFVGYGGGSTLDDGPYTDFESFAITYNGTNVLCHYGEILESDSDFAASSTRVLGDGRLFNEDPESSSRTGIGWFRSLLLYKEALDDDTRNSITNAMKARYGIM